MPCIGRHIRNVADADLIESFLISHHTLGPFRAATTDEHAFDLLFEAGGLDRNQAACTHGPSIDTVADQFPIDEIL